MAQEEASNEVPRGRGQEGNDGRGQRHSISHIIYVYIVEKEDETGRSWRKLERDGREQIFTI